LQLLKGKKSKKNNHNINNTNNTESMESTVAVGGEFCAGRNREGEMRS